MTKFCLSELSALAGSDVDPGLLLQWRTNTQSDDFRRALPATVGDIRTMKSQTGRVYLLSFPLQLHMHLKEL